MDVRQSRSPRGVVLSLAVLLAVASGCGTVSYNRYQDADTLGKGKMRLQAAAQWQPSLVAPVADDLDEELDDEFLEWAAAHPGYDDVDFEQLLIEILVFPALIPFAAWGYADKDSPRVEMLDFELLYAVGLHDRVDFEARATLGGYYRVNAKIKLAEFGGSGAVSFAPGIGYRYFRFSDHYGTGNFRSLLHEIEFKDTFEGHIVTGEAPLLIGWKTKYASPYLAPFYTYHYVPVHATRVLEDAALDWRTNLRRDYHVHTVGLAAGVKLQFGRFVLTPEVVGLYNATFDTRYLAPGLAIGASWD